MPSRAQAPRVRVAAIARNPETADGIHQYLHLSGIASRTACELNASIVTGGVNALLLFPDEFPSEDVFRLLLAMRSARPDLLIVVVSASRRALSAALAPDGRSVPPVLIPKPAFGWSILDTLRMHSDVKVNPLSKTGWKALRMPLLEG